jgi:predicted ATP-dependent endonuclease of OLD family
MFWANINQFKKIKDLINEFEAFESKSRESYQPLKEYLDTLNKFFCDSSKEIYFEPETSELKFKILNKNGGIIADKRDIQSLSSGELQILILFTILKFNDTINNSKIIIIDEPELSLHPKWQEDFMKALEILTPADTQIIIATHSPLIVGDNKKYCKVLLPYN